MFACECVSASSTIDSVMGDEQNEIVVVTVLCGVLCVGVRHPCSSGGGGGVCRSGGGRLHEGIGVSRDDMLSGFVGVFLEVGVGVFRSDG